MKPGDFTHVHFIGVGGIGMSALARLCLHEGKTVSGSDVKETAITQALEKEGVKMSYKQQAGNIKKSHQLVIYTEAVDQKNNEEFLAAKEQKIETINYFDALGLFLNDYYLIAVAGSHGKTTTTAMLTDILEQADLDPTAIIGSIRKETNSNFRPGTSKYAVVEACEYRRDFLSLKPDVLVITNIEYEHVDYYKNLEDVQKAFRELAEQVATDGVIVANTDDPQIATALEGITSVGTIDYTQFFDPLFEELPAPGIHNRLNAAAAIAVADYLKVDRYLAREALKEFQGTWRRFENKGTLNGAVVIDDYAHHPTEIKHTIATVRDLYPEKTLKVVFQPHTHSRLEALFEDFAKELALADEVSLLPVYRAREGKGTKESTDLATTIAETNQQATHFETKEGLEEHLKNSICKDDVLLVMGAGDVTELASELTK